MTVMAEAWAAQLGGQAVIELPKLLPVVIKIAKELLKAGKHSYKFTNKCNAEFALVSRTVTSIKHRYTSAPDELIVRVDRIQSSARHVIRQLFRSMHHVLKRGYGWKIKWTIMRSHWNRSYQKLVQLSEELVRIKSHFELDDTVKTRKQKVKAACASLPGAVIGGFVAAEFGADIGATIGLAVGGPAGICIGVVVGGLLGAAIGYLWL